VARDTEADKTGDKGELMAELLLSDVALVNPYKKDIGLDFFCELRTHAGMSFFIQAKGSSTPKYTETTISSLPVDCKTIEEYWLKKREPVFILMSDVTANKTYYLLVNQDTYKPSRVGQKTYTFSIPLSNEITRDNIGNFAASVMRNQRYVSREEAERLLEEHYEKNPELYHDLDEISRFLEVMRGSDQEAQLETKMLLKKRYESGLPISQELRKGLVSVFINCKDRITQSHVLDALIFINERSVVPEILKQVERNLRLYEYRWADESRRHTYISFLFNALIRLKPTNILKQIESFLRVKDINVNRGAIRASGDLKLNGAIPHILRFLGHPDDGVRCDVARALCKLDKQKVTRKLKKIFSESEDKLQLIGLIQTFAEFKNAELTSAILTYADDPSRDVRKAVALYLGAISPDEHIELLLRLMMDHDHKVRSEAKRSVSKCLPAYTQKLERTVLPLLKKAYDNRQVLDVSTLLSFCTGPESIPTVLKIYRTEEGEVINFKTQALEILKRNNSLEIQADIVKHIQSADDSTRVKHIIAAGEMRLEEAFSPLLKQLSEERTWPGFIISSLLSIDSQKTRAWAVNELKCNPPIELSFICFDIIYRIGGENDNSGLIKEQIRRLMNDPEIRKDLRIYDYVDRYRVTETSSLIVNDLKAAPIEYSIALRMLKTLSLMKSPEGRELIIQAMKCEEGMGIRHFIEFLGTIGDSASLSALKEYEDHPDPEISKLVKKYLSNISME
jgi:HEAT repeat protein